MGAGVLDIQAARFGSAPAGAGGLQRVGLADAAGAEAGVAAEGRLNGPFWPHPAISPLPSSAAHSSTGPTALRTGRAAGAATLVARVWNMTAILSTPSWPALRPPVTHRLTDTDYQALTQALLARIEAQADRWLQDDVIDIDTHRTGGLLELSFPDGSKIIINTQPPLQEVWLAARAGGFHYRWHDDRWVDTRDGSEFLSALSQHASRQGGRPLTF